MAMFWYTMAYGAGYSLPLMPMSVKAP